MKNVSSPRCLSEGAKFNVFIQESLDSFQLESSLCWRKRQMEVLHCTYLAVTFSGGKWKRWPSVDMMIRNISTNVRNITKWSWINILLFLLMYFFIVILELHLQISISNVLWNAIWCQDGQVASGMLVCFNGFKERFEVSCAKALWMSHGLRWVF